MVTWYIASLYVFVAFGLFLVMVLVNMWLSARGLPVEQGRVVASTGVHQPGSSCRLLTIEVNQPRAGLPARFTYQDCQRRGGLSVGDAVPVARDADRVVLDPPSSAVAALLPGLAVFAGGAMFITAVFLFLRRRHRVQQP